MTLFMYDVIMWNPNKNKEYKKPKSGEEKRGKDEEDLEVGCVYV